MPTYAPSDWYQTPLYYDIIYDQDTAREAAFLQAVFDTHVGRRGGWILEPACGTGRLLVAMARRGFGVCGFDLSQAMLDFAHTRLAKALITADVGLGRMEQFRYRRRFDLAHCLYSTFKYLLSEDDARAHLQCVAKALRPGGVYVLGLHVTDYQQPGCTRERWTARRGGTQVICNVQDWPPDRRFRRQRVRTRLVVHRRNDVLRYETNWQFRTYSRGELTSLLASVPSFEHIATYDFRHDIDEPVTLDHSDADKVLILRRR